MNYYVNVVHRSSFQH